MPTHQHDIDAGTRWHVRCGLLIVCVNHTTEGIIVDVYDDNEVYGTLAVDHPQDEGE